MGLRGGGAACLNCGAALQGPYCHRCGQKGRDPDPTLRELLSDLLEMALNWDSRLLVTLRHLVLRPGLATAEYNAGRRARYVSPIRLYLVVSVLFLTAATLAGEAAIETAELTAEVRAPQVEAGGEARDVWSWVVRGFGWSMFLLVPGFAGLLKLLYLRSGRRYVHHLVFAVHYHSFAFLALMPLLVLALVTPGIWLAFLAAGVMLWIGLWLLPAMRRAYGQPWSWTVLKAGVLAWLYFTLLVPLGTIPMAVVLAAVLGST